MSKKTSDSKSDFVNGIVMRLNKEELKIIVICNGFGQGSYTDRKCNGLFRGLDFSDFNVEKIVKNTSFGDKFANVTITLKK